MLRVLHNPRYAGAFSYGRHRQHKLPGGRSATTLLPREQWTAFIPGAHPGYITAEQFETNHARLAANAAAHGADRTTGPPREGPALLQGVIVCGRCGQRMTVRYHHRRGREIPNYLCQRDGIENATRICQAIPGAQLDTRAEQADQIRAAHVQRARYHAELARRRYLAVDPANRLVAESLEADWNLALRNQNQAQDAYDTARDQRTGQLTDTQRARIGQLVTDLPAIWNAPDTPQRERKRIARLLLTDVTVHRTADTITAHIRLPGGQHNTLTLPMPKTACDMRTTPPEIITAIDELLDRHTSSEIADVLNTRGLRSGDDKTFTRTIVSNIARTYQLPSRRQRLREAGLLTLTEMAKRLGVSPSTVKTWGARHGCR